MKSDLPLLDPRRQPWLAICVIPYTFDVPGEGRTVLDDRIPDGAHLVVIPVSRYVQDQELDDRQFERLRIVSVQLPHPSARLFLLLRKHRNLHLTQ
jgi:hypothetical protein